MVRARRGVAVHIGGEHGDGAKRDARAVTLAAVCGLDEHLTHLARVVRPARLARRLRRRLQAHAVLDRDARMLAMQVARHAVARARAAACDVCDPLARVRRDETQVDCERRHVGHEAALDLLLARPQARGALALLEARGQAE